MAYSGIPVLKFFGSLEPHNLTNETIRKYISIREGEGRHIGTIWTELNHLKMTTNWATREGIIKDAPAFSLPSRSAPRVDYLTKDQVRALLAATDTPHVRLFTILACSTGARNRALLELTWDRVDLLRRRIDFTVPDQINRKGRALVPINDTLFAELSKMKDLTKSDYVIEFRGHPVLSVKKALERLAKKLSIPRVSPHIFRHSAAVWMVESGASMEEVAQFLGHKNTVITRLVYARFSPEYLSQAAKALDL